MSEQTQAIALEGEQATPDGLQIWSCVSCRRRKLRCNRIHPCPNCVRSKIDCHFPVTGRLPRRSAQPATSPAQKQTELLGRIRRLEAVVTELAGQMDDGTSGSLSVTPQDTAALWQKDDDPMENFGSLVTDANGSLRVAKGFWSIFCNEVDNIFQAVVDVPDVNPAEETITLDNGPNAEGSIRSDHQRFVFGSPLDTYAHEEVKLLPLPSQMLFLWQIFCDSVDIFMAVLDITATTRLIHSIKGSFTTLSLEHQALMASISLAAIVSLDEEDVSFNFDLSKPQLLARLKLGTEQALASAEFMTTRSFVVAQAFAIYVTILPQLGAMQLAAPMTAILVRMALSLGLHKDPETVKQGLTSSSIADIETRRRLWWQVCFLDARVRHADVPMLSISPTTATTKEPTDLDDTPGGKRKFSKISLCQVRCELWRLSHDLRNMSKDDTNSQKQLISDTHTRIAHAYFRNLDESDSSLRTFAHLLTRLFFTNLDYSVQNRQPRSAEQIANVLATAESLMETTIALNSRPQWRTWRWQLQGYAPWSVMLSTLQLLSRGPWTTQAHRAWSSLQRLVDCLPTGAHELRVLQVIRRRIELIRGSMQPRDGDDTAANEYQRPTSDQGSTMGAQRLNPRQVVEGDFELPDFSAVEDGEASLHSLQESWNPTEVREEAPFQWEDLQEAENVMDWQFLNGTLDPSLYWGQHPF